MTSRYIAPWAAIAVVAFSLGACATAHRPAPEAIADNTTPDAETLAPEFHGARVGQDHLRGALPSE